MATVTVTQGTLRGAQSETKEKGFQYFSFQDIPYAKPPLNDLRFKSPQPPESWEGERDATLTNSNHISIQMNNFTGQVLGSEDCLYLNVYTPKISDDETEKLPVMVYIHGGGFSIANGIIKNDSEPDYLIEHNVVVVTINYRLNIFGFLSLDIPEASGNMGLKDQVKALEWIQQNIGKFGGNKDNVTIFGVSAGAASVEYHIVSPLSKGLFHKAILQSGSFLNHWAINFDNKKLVLNVIERLGYAGTTSDNHAIYEYLIGIPSTTLISTVAQASSEITNRVFFGFVPCIEKDFGNGQGFLLENPYTMLKEDRFEHVPIIKGFCAKEGYMSRFMIPRVLQQLVDDRKFMDHWSYELEVMDIDKYNEKFENAYLQNINPGEELDNIVDFFSDLDFVSGILTAGKILAGKHVPVYIYQFVYDGKINFFKSTFGLQWKGAAHSDDLAYVLGSSSTVMPEPSDILTRNRMTKMWTDFAKTSTPTPRKSGLIRIQWPSFTPESPVYMKIDREFELKYDYEPKRIAIFEKIYDKYKK